MYPATTTPPVPSAAIELGQPVTAVVQSTPLPAAFSLTTSEAISYELVSAEGEDT
jgi:hypothetical protein